MRSPKIHCIIFNMMKEAITWQKQKKQLFALKYISVQLHNVWWQQIPIPHCSWEK
jgi:hypothetical protein